MRHRAWVDVAIAVLALLLVCGSQPAVAQAPPGSPPGAGQGPAAGDATQWWNTVTQLRAEVAQLRQEVAQLRQEVERIRLQAPRVGSAGEAEPGTGGSGAGEAPGGGGPAGGGEATGGGGPAGGTRAREPGRADVSVRYTGRVRSVSSRQLVLEGDQGGRWTLPLASKVQVERDGQPLSLQALRQGMRVQAQADLYAPGEPVSQVVVLSPPP